MKRLLLLIPTVLFVVTLLFPTPSVAAKFPEDSGPVAIATRPATATAVITVPVVATPATKGAALPPTTLLATAIPAQAVLFPIPANATLIPNFYGDDTTIFTTSLAFADVVSFYRDALATNGAQEREYLTFIEQEDGWFSIVFDGWTPAEGQAVVIQGVEFPQGTSTVSIRLEAVN